MAVSLWRAFLVLLVVTQPIVTRVNSIFAPYCKGAVHKKCDIILAGKYVRFFFPMEEQRQNNWPTRFQNISYGVESVQREEGFRLPFRV